MSRLRTLLKLAARNTSRATGRLAILAFVLAAAIVARSTTYLVEEGLVREAANAVTAPNIPEGANVIAFSTMVSYTPDSLRVYAFQKLGYASWEKAWRYLAGFCELYAGPTGELRVLRPYPDERNRNPQADWFSRLEGWYPERPDEVAIPAPLAAATGLRPGDTVRLYGGIPQRVVTFTVSGVYTPLGYGPFYDYLLSVLDPTEPVELNWMLTAALRGPRTIDALRTWGAAGTTEVTVYDSLRTRMTALARDVYSSGSRAVSMGYGLAGIAVLVILLVAMLERKREAAAYKMVGMNSLATLTVLGTELGLAAAIALVVAAPAYWFLAARYVLDAHAGSRGILALPFAASTAWTVLIGALGAAYPFALASMGTPNQLLMNQRVYLFRRRQILRGWVEVDSE